MYTNWGQSKIPRHKNRGDVITDSVHTYISCCCLFFFVFCFFKHIATLTNLYVMVRRLPKGTAWIFGIFGVCGTWGVYAFAQGSRFFRFNIQILQNIATSGVGTPPMSLAPPHGKSWIHHWFVWFYANILKLCMQSLFGSLCIITYGCANMVMWYTSFREKTFACFVTSNAIHEF